jgi:hypothetical protein
VHYPSEQDAPKKELYKNKKNKKNHETKAGNTNNKSKGNFNNFPQRQYDFNKLEKGLLGIENVNIDDIQEV